jgi:hypothetical protein
VVGLLQLLLEEMKEVLSSKELRWKCEGLESVCNRQSGEIVVSYAMSCHRSRHIGHEWH